MIYVKKVELLDNFYKSYCEVNRKSMKKERIQINVEKCTGCRVCESICTFSRYGEFNPKRSRIRVVKMERLSVDVPICCRHCLKPLCVQDCPVDALTQDRGGIIQVNEERCTGCEACVEACPFGAISVEPITGMAIVCDMCNGDPQCVKWCPAGALSNGISDITAQMRRWDTAILSAKRLLRKWGIPWEEYEEYYGELEPKRKRKRAEIEKGGVQ